MHTLESQQELQQFLENHLHEACQEYIKFEDTGVIDPDTMPILNHARDIVDSSMVILVIGSTLGSLAIRHIIGEQS